MQKRNQDNLFNRLFYLFRDTRHIKETEVHCPFSNIEI